MNLGLSDKRAVVLASTAGLGLAVAEELLQEGDCVALCGRDEARLKQALERLSRDHGERVFGGVVDVTDKEALAAHLHSGQGSLGPRRHSYCQQRRAATRTSGTHYR